ncbi:glycosyl hydrolase family 8 [Clostridium tarantellae]|uniref:Glycosyl hydrolase family 8 n=1 Tax=Clostridium tarantellae TaxID=39493 RepID=A0A6I1MMV6_9CLOT|nr:glycosyl hydrolase family 8 [Clostridium tarantellae]MPQ44364.1 glycosyl hydrolase family 8 [Clostridium tarantellae]
MKKKFIIALSFIVILILIFGVLNIFPYFKKLNLPIIWEIKKKNYSEKLVYDFINKSLMRKNEGIYTNYLKFKSEGDITKGHSILSESEGLIMLYAVNSGDKKLFEDHYRIIKNNMKLDNGLISWRIEDGVKSDVSATIDELRIAKSLIFAYDRWGDFKYKVSAINISKALLKNAVYNNNLIDYVSPEGKSFNITLCYLDLYTMKILSSINGDWNKIYNNSMKILNEGIISDNVPLYKKTYSFKKNEYDKEENIDLLLSLIVILNRIECGQEQNKAIKWIEDKFYYYGYLVSAYDKKTGEEASKIESPSIYALTALIAKATENQKLFEKSIKRLEQYQIKDKSSELYGSFGNKDTLDVYSFDNLNALLAFQKK